MNGLKQSWKLYKGKGKAKRKRIAWCNPPHDKTKLWVIKAYKEWKKDKVKTLMLIPINVLTSTYAKRYLIPIINIDKKMILTGRIYFLTVRSQKISEFPSVNGYVNVLTGNKKN